MKPKTLQCPSYIAKPGAELFGIVNDDGKIEYLEEAITIDKTFVEAAKLYNETTGRVPEGRFRFSGKCMQGGCSHWNNDHDSCSLISKIIANTNKIPETNSVLFSCAIRSGCRWFAQEGNLACANCNETVRNKEKARLTNDKE